MTFWALDLFDYAKAPGYSRTMLEIRRGFGRFYSSRYTSSNTQDGAARERAVFYLTSALNVSIADLNAAANGDLGLLYAFEGDLETDTEKKTAIWELAIKHLRIANDQRPSDARVLVALAWIARRQGRLQEAIDLLTKVIEASPPANSERRHYTLARYNRACYFVQDGAAKDQPVRTEFFRKAIDDLWQVKDAVSSTDAEWWANLLQPISTASRAISRPSWPISPLKSRACEIQGHANHPSQKPSSKQEGYPISSLVRTSSSRATARSTAFSLPYRVVKTQPQLEGRRGVPKDVA
jgi:tetratricopeptide (TPR) repeat protein